MKHLAFVFTVVALLGLVLLLPPLGAQNPPAPRESNVILRISRPFLAELTGRTLTRDEPISTTILGAAVEGTAHLDGKFNVKLHKSETESAFDLLLAGDVRTQSAATRRPVIVHTHGVAPFRASRRIDFTGKDFIARDIETEACYSSNVDEICSFRGGIGGALTRTLARPAVRRNQPEGDRIAEERIRTQVTDTFREESDKLMPLLNKVADVAERGVQLLRDRNVFKEADLNYKLTATEDFLLVGLGPKEQTLPVLPLTPDPDDVSVELWFRRPQQFTEVQGNELFEKVKERWKAISPDLRKRLLVHAPELPVLLIENVTRETAGKDKEWRVIRFAKGFIKMPAK